MRIRTMAAFAAGVVMAAAGTAVATTKVAAIVSPDNQIHGCYLTSAGLLRVVAAGEACREGEAAIAWSATGSGTPGPAGPKGEPGVRWRGNWVSGTNYAGGDLVRSGGRVWLRQSGVIACLVGQSCSNTVAPAGAAGWSVFAMDGAAGARGADGARGPKGDPGATGPAGGLRGYQIVRASSTAASYPSGGLRMWCPAGKKAIGGGFWVSGGTVAGSEPFTQNLFAGAVEGAGWQVQVNWNAIGGGVVIARAVCAEG